MAKDKPPENQSRPRRENQGPDSIRAELERTRRLLEEERTFSQGVIASQPGLFFMIDDQGCYRRWNKNLERLLGYSAEEIRLRDFRDFVPPEDRERLHRAVQKTLAQGASSLYYHNQTKDGRSIPFFARGLRVEIGGRFYVIGVELDLSDLREAEEALRRSEEHLRSLMETATNFAVYRLAFEEGDPGSVRVVFVSPSIKRILGVEDPSRLEGWLANVHPRDRERTLGDHLGLPRPERTQETMRVLVPGEEDTRWVQFLSTSILDENGGLRFSNGIIFDVTDRVRAVEALKANEAEMKQQADQLAKVNTALQVLVEHRESEIRAMETSILNTLERLVKPYLGELDRERLPGEQRVYLDIIKSNLDKITSPLTRKLSEWQGRLSPAEIRVADLIRNGKSTKEMADLLGVSDNAVSFHRKNIRAKLGLSGRKLNLASFLQSLDRG